MFEDINEAYYWLDQRDDSRTRMLKKLRFYRRQEQGLDFEEKMFRERKSYRTLFLTVGLKPDHREDVTLPTMQRYRKRFFRHIREAGPRDELLYGVQGILWKFEEGGRSGGLHLHLVIFYEAGRSGDVSICRALGEYWVDRITHGWGGYRNSNATKHDHKHRWGIAVGQIGRDHHEMRDSLRKVIGVYMAKTMQEPKDSDADDKLWGTVKPIR
ncbi:hypothetical protein G5S34_08630 [Herbaspirillum frisingense]|uniref:hypothetical protein n=1 Tax=Herbaspirillum frisingense TaxID=92645 RepID=UPI0016028571|nr:hypothetical protein [Herbaspirillum frisingense]QNB06828.1 hypothetical protein G5S34_08630 [Herbaspirillum frisingense]